MYDSFKEQGLPVELIGIGTETYISGLDNWTNNNNAPVVSEESPFFTWTNWGASQRDLFVLDQSGNGKNGTIVNADFSTDIVGSSAEGNELYTSEDTSVDLDLSSYASDVDGDDLI